LSRLLAGLERDGPVELDRHVATHGELPDLGDGLIAEVERSGLRGRGGAAFPAAVKLSVVAAGERPVVVVNGTEGEPMSAKDRSLLMRTPHLVLDGAIAAADAVGARSVLIAAPEYTHMAVAAALRQRPEGRRRRDRVRVTLTASARGYVAGEETAVLAHLEGRPAKPRVVPPLPAQSGYRRRPTLVQNVETLAHMALIARHGAGWFRESGTGDRPGTMLVTISGAVQSPGVYEATPGVDVADVIQRAGGQVEPLRALLVGGYFGAWVVPGPGLEFDEAALRPHGASLGAGVVVALGQSSCPVAETARLAAYMALSTAGQCGPCVNGLGALANVVERYAGGRVVAGDPENLRRWIDMVRGRGACRHPDGVARMLASAVRVFARELDEHGRRGPCRACARPTILSVPTERSRRAAA
jgi:NADH:ubiquinone oxidoreductase subunit F (NADH-binding)